MGSATPSECRWKKSEKKKEIASNPANQTNAQLSSMIFENPQQRQNVKHFNERPSKNAARIFPTSQRNQQARYTKRPLSSNLEVVAENEEVGDDDEVWSGWVILWTLNADQNKKILASPPGYDRGYREDSEETGALGLCVPYLAVLTRDQR